MLCKGEHRRRKKDGDGGILFKYPLRGRGVGGGKGGGEEITLKKFRLIFIRYIWKGEDGGRNWILIKK